MDEVRVEDIEVCYRLEGSGVPLVMIMGFNGTQHGWHPALVSALSSRHACLLFDNRGTGCTGTGEARFSIRRFADDTAGLMERLGIGRANVMGVSLGGMIAQELALEHPEKVLRLVLCSTTFGGVRAKAPSFQVLRRFLTAREIPPDLMLLKEIEIIYPDDYLATMPEELAWELMEAKKSRVKPLNAIRQVFAAAGFRSYHRLPGLKAPTLVLTGTRDVLVPVGNSRILAGRLPDARLIEIPGAGHGMITQCHREVASVVNAFLGGRRSAELA